MAVKEKSTREKPTRKKAPAKKEISAENLLRVELVRSLIGRPRKQREVVKGLGLRRINSSVLRQDCPEIRGMIRKVEHLVRVEVVEKK
jgi:large subunit ribosomal protein L30